MINGLFLHVTNGELGVLSSLIPRHMTPLYNHHRDTRNRVDEKQILR